MEGEPVGVFGMGSRPLDARYARMRGEGARIAGLGGVEVWEKFGLAVAVSRGVTACKVLAGVIDLDDAHLHRAITISSRRTE
jgi:hypothetical protein